MRFVNSFVMFVRDFPWCIWQGRSGWAKMADFEEQLSDEEKVIDNQFMLSGLSSLLCFWDMYDLYIDMNVS